LKTVTLNVEVFRTNVQQQFEAELIIGYLRELFPLSSISFDLEDCDRILRIEGQDTYQNNKIIQLLNLNNFECEKLD